VEAEEWELTLTTSVDLNGEGKEIWYERFFGRY
jgi:hypothetical protein